MMAYAVKAWKNVPVIVVITKSYSETERNNNIENVRDILQRQKVSVNLKSIIPVVAKEYQINDQFVAPPFGIDTLIKETENIIPEGLRASKKTIEKYALNIKRAQAQAVVTTAVVGACATAAVPIHLCER